VQKKVRLFGDVLERQLLERSSQSPRELIAGRYNKYRRMARFFDPVS